MKKRMFSLIIKLIAIIASIYGIVRTYFGWMSFTYFTVLSNIFITIMLAIFVVEDIISIKNNKKYSFPNILYLVKFLATISITLTFVVFLTLLAPTNPGGFIASYISNGAGSLCVHFITPVLAIIDFIINDIDYNSKNIHSIYAIIPPLFYTVFVVIASSLGLRWGNMYAPYNFLNYGVPTGWFGFGTSIVGWETLGIGVAYNIIILSIIFIIIGRIFIFLRNKINK